MLQLEALQANDGDCLLLHYDNGGNPRLILIDGGSSGIYRNVIEKRLDQLRGNSPVLNLRLIVVSHIDADHITGILDMFRQMSESVNDGREPRWKVESLWHNAFEKVVGSHAPSASSAVIATAAAGTVNMSELEESGLDNEKAVAVVASVKQGKDLQSFAKTLTTINRESNGKLVMAPEIGRKQIKVDQNLTFTILGPQEVELRDLEKEWQKSKAKHATNEKAAAADYLNRTVPNLSSIVFLAEHMDSVGKTTRMLLTGDAGGDLILKGLDSAGLLDHKKKIKVDVLKIQHHGSNHSITEEFFRQVIADKYVISGNGKNGIPHMDVLCWLSNARDGEACEIYMTNRQLSDGDTDLTKSLDDFLAKEAEHQRSHRYYFRKEEDLSIAVS